MLNQLNGDYTDAGSPRLLWARNRHQEIRTSQGTMAVHHGVRPRPTRKTSSRTTPGIKQWQTSVLPTSTISWVSVQSEPSSMLRGIKTRPFPDLLSFHTRLGRHSNAMDITWPAPSPSSETVFVVGPSSPLTPVITPWCPPVVHPAMQPAFHPCVHHSSKSSFDHHFRL